MHETEFRERIKKVISVYYDDESAERTSLAPMRNYWCSGCGVEPWVIVLRSDSQIMCGVCRRMVSMIAET